MHRYDDEIIEWKRIIKLHPEVGGFHLRLGIAYEKAEKKQEAKHSFEKAIDIEPNLADEIFQYGNEEYDSGNYEEAIEYYNNVIRLEHDSIDAHYALEKTYIQLGKDDLALEQHETVKKLKP